MDEHAGGYRDAALPRPQRFPIRMSGGARLALFVSLATIVFSILVLVLTGRLFILFVAALGPGIFYLLSGAPRSIDVHHDSVVIHSWVRRPIEIPASDLRAQRTEDALVLATQGAIITIGADHFPGDSLDRCVEAMRARGMRVVESV